jgi:hypothetical protein
MSTPTPTPTPTPNVDAQPSEPGSTLQFVVCATVVCVGLGILAGQAPPRIRLLGLFSLGFGLLAGGLLSSLAGWLNVRLNVVMIAAIGVMTLGGMVIGVCATVANQPRPPTPRDLHPIEAQVVARMPPPQPPDFGSRVRTYLHLRVEMLGDWSSPWPEVFWGGELLLGTAGSVWMALRGRSREARP